MENFQSDIWVHVVETHIHIQRVEPIRATEQPALVKLFLGFEADGRSAQMAHNKLLENNMKRKTE